MEISVTKTCARTEISLKIVLATEPGSPARNIRADYVLELGVAVTSGVDLRDVVDEHQAGASAHTERKPLAPERGSLHGLDQRGVLRPEGGVVPQHVRRLVNVLLCSRVDLHNSGTV